MHIDIPEEKFPLLSQSPMGFPLEKLDPVEEVNPVEELEQKRAVHESRLLEVEAIASCLSSIVFAVIFADQFEADVKSKGVPFSSVYHSDHELSPSLFPRPVESVLCLSLLSLTVCVVRAVAMGLGYLPRIVSFLYDAALLALWYVLWIVTMMPLDTPGHPIETQWAGVLVITPLLALYLCRVETAIWYWREELKLRIQLCQEPVQRY